MFVHVEYDNEVHFGNLIGEPDFDLVRQRHFVSAGARYSITPLFNLQTYAVVDPVGPSVLFMPVASYNVTTNTDVSVGGQLFASSPSSEFDPVPNLFYLEFTVHF